MEWLDRQINLIGEDGIKKLNNSEISVFGLGGVGSYTLETLVRAGIGRVNIVDNDVIDKTNINRQLYALNSTIGKRKIDIAKERCLDINPELEIKAFDLFIENKEDIIKIVENSDYILDCIDTIDSKLKIIEVAKELDIPIISSMSTGNKLEPKALKVTDIFNTKTCPIAKKTRKALRDLNIDSLKVLCSSEDNMKIDKNINKIATVSFIPSVAGILMTAECIKDLLNIER